MFRTWNIKDTNVESYVFINVIKFGDRHPRFL